MTNDSTFTNLPLHLGKTLRLYSPTSLSTDYAELLPSLTTLINLCYSVGHSSSPHGILLPYSWQRLSTNTSLIEEVGKDGFIFILTAHTPEDGKPGLIASASAKPFKELDHHELAQGSHVLTNFKRKATAPKTTSLSSDFVQVPHPSSEHDPDAVLDKDSALPKWEIICNVVHPDYQKRGIAGQLHDAVIKEIRSRESPNEDQDVDLVITTMKELNEVYYQKRGFVTTAEKRFEKGVGGSEVGFSVVETEKIV